MPKIEKHAAKYDMKVELVKNIHYGKQLKFSAGRHWAEINLFYGSKGFKVVATTKTGSNVELAEISKKILCELLY